MKYHPSATRISTIKQLSIGVALWGLLSFSSEAQTSQMMVRQVYNSPGSSKFVTTTATFDISSLTGVGTELIPLDSLTMVFSFRGFLQTARIVPSAPPYPSGTLVAGYQDGVFDGISSIDAGGSGQIKVDPPSNAFGETISIVNKPVPELLDRPCCAGFSRYLLSSTVGPCISGVASASFRNDGSNPSSYTAAIPLLGSTWSASVDLTTTGHSFAELYAFTGPSSITLGGGQVLLVGGVQAFKFPAQAGPLATWVAPIPNDCALVGFTVYTQAVHFGGVTPYALSNARDLSVGY